MNRLAELSPVYGVAPCRGYELRWGYYEDGDRFRSRFFVAVGHGRAILLNTSRFFFTPTQERFDYLVRSGFPGAVQFPNGMRAPFCNVTLDRLIGAELARAA